MPSVHWLTHGEGTQFPLRWQTRLRAWWEGYDISCLTLSATQQADKVTEIIHEMPVVAVASHEPLTRFGKPQWTANRVQVAETLWGADFISPGGAEHTTSLVKPFGITSSMSILDLSAGLGGAARTLATQYKAWITGMEASPLLSNIAMERSEKAGLAKQAPVTHYDANNLSLPRRYDGIFAKESFFTVQNKEKMFDTIAEGLKSGGQFLFTDYCVDKTEVTDPRLLKWIAKEPVTPHLWTVEAITKALKTRKLDMRICEDMTDMQRKLILRSLGHFLQHLDSHSLTKETKAAVLDEVELWARRMAAFDSGLRLYRFYCMKH